MSINTPSSIAAELRRAANAHPNRDHSFRLGYLEEAVKGLAERLELQLPPQQIVEDLQGTRRRLMDYLTTVNNSTRDWSFRAGQLRGAIEVANLHLELLADNIERHSNLRKPENTAA